MAYVPVPTGDGGPPLQVREGEGDSPTLLATALGTVMPSSPPSSIRLSKDGNLKKDTTTTIAEEAEKINAENREIAGEDPEGTAIEGIEDHELWTMLRRFDTQVNHVLAPANDIPYNEPDLRITNLPDVAFRPDTLKANFERVYTIVGPSAIQGVRELARLSDWENELIRTSIYCTVYFVAWFFGYTLLVCATFASILACFPATRRYLFPRSHPHPLHGLSATDPTNEKGDESLVRDVKGNIQHRSKSEQAEEQAFEARAIFESFTATTILGVQLGKKENSNVGAKDIDPPHKDPMEGKVIRDEQGDGIGRRRHMEDVIHEGQVDAVVGDKALHVDHDNDVDKAVQQEVKSQRDELVGKMTKTTETGLGTVADLFEILQNSLSPPVLYPDSHSRFKLATCFFLLPALLMHTVPAVMLGRITTFSMGAALWGWKLGVRAFEELQKLDVNWKEVLDIRNSVLSGTPTNAQLVLHILRMAEGMCNPVGAPPAPPLHETAKNALDTPPAPFLGRVTTEDFEAIDQASTGADKQVQKAKVKGKGRFTSALKRVTLRVARIGGDVAVDGKKKQVASFIRRSRLNSKFNGESPDAFECRLDGSAGHVIVDGAQRRLAWLPVQAEMPQHIWDIDDLVEIKKDTVSMRQMALGMMGGGEVESLGLTLRFAPRAKQEVEKEGVKGTDEGSDQYHFERVARRNPLFNRLIATGSQRWEML